MVTRRSFLIGGAGAAFAGRLATPGAQTPGAGPARPSSVIRTTRTQVLEIGYFEAGEPSAFPVVLLHGFPDDAHAYDDVAPALAHAGYRALVPFLRGFGPTRFLDPAATRTAEQAAIGQDVIDFADALHLSSFAVCGYDWGGRAAAIASVLAPGRIRAAALIVGYSIQDTLTRRAPPTAEAARRLWYQWYLNTEVGRDALMQDRRGLCRLLWREWSPTWTFTEGVFEQTAASFDNPDFVDCVVHSYRHRNFNAPGESRFADAERFLAGRPPIRVPTMLIYGADDTLGRATADITATERQRCPMLQGKRLVAGAGHFVPHERPQETAVALLDLLKSAR